MKQKKLALSIRGAAAEGPAYIGALKALCEEGIKPDMIIGASAGAMVGAAYAFGLTFDEMKKRMEKLTYPKLIGLDSFKAFSDGAIVSREAMLNYCDECFGKVNIEDAKIPLYIQVTNIKTGKPEIFEKGPLSPALFASCSMPPLMSPVTINGNEYIDGGYSIGYSAGFLRNKGAEAVIGITIDSEDMFNKEKQNFLDSIFIMVKTIHDQDLKLEPVDYLLDNLGSHDVGILDFSAGMKLVDRGYNLTKGRIPEIKAIIQKQSFLDFFK
jgi:NTE family protein